MTLSLTCPLFPAPGIWAPQSTLPWSKQEILVTPPLGWEWDGHAAAFFSHPGALAWTPPRHPIERFLERMAHLSYPGSWLITLAADAPPALTKAVRVAEQINSLQGLILWWWEGADILAATIAARKATLFPLLVEVPTDLALSLAPALAEAGADALLLGPPRAQGEGGRVLRLWGPALFPTIEYTLALLIATIPQLTYIVAAGVASPSDARRALQTGAKAIALGPEWWVAPDLADRITTTLAETKTENAVSEI